MQEFFLAIVIGFAFLLLLVCARLKSNGKPPDLWPRDVPERWKRDG